VNGVKVEVNTVLQGDGSTLGAFLYHPEPDGRVKAETVLYEEGAQFVVYPHVLDLAPVEGTALVADFTLTISVGPLYVISPLEVPADAVRAAKRVSLYLLREPFRAGDRTEKTVLAASLPLDILERGSAT
jgi:hypothetical protein